MLPTISLGFAGHNSSNTYSSAFLDFDAARCARGCDALLLVLAHARLTGTDRVLVPTVHCPSIPDAMLGGGFHPDFYSVNADLTPAIDDVTRKLRSGARALLLIHYFGFTQKTELFRRLCDQYGTLLIEDCAHTFFGRTGRSLPGRTGHYAIASSRKLFPIPDGGAAISNTEPMSGASLESISLLDEIKRLARTIQLAANAGKVGNLSHGLSRLMSRLDSARRTEVQKIGNTPTPRDVHLATAKTRQLKKMSRVARLLMQATNVDRLTEIRRRNYALLLNGISKMTGCSPLFPELPDDCVPYVFPVVLRDPSLAFPKLKMRGVPMYRWEDMASSQCHVAKHYESALIQLPCHQELTTGNIAWLLDQLRDATDSPPQ